MNGAQVSRSGQNQRIQVIVRVRPINNTEKGAKSTAVIEVPSNRDVVVRGRLQDVPPKIFRFNRVFGPLSKQTDVYNVVVGPLVEEVLAGYSGTVFAYGQTGTGKTFTMEGGSNDPTLHWQSDTTVGMIPRALGHLFEKLRSLKAQEYTVRVSFLELYNKELFDLLSASDDALKIRLYEDAARRGAVIIHGLEEVTVHNESEARKILAKGSEKRQTAATLMNAHSSRSHTIFSMTVHMKENTVDGEDLLKTGKLNLVDLAGSENVGRSGSVDRRAREAGSINQSLLTLGRVITALVNTAPHIPYRESKLTRLLQDSLGGRSKTSIIATVSPASINLKESLSTLDYALRAKNITNRPKINRKLSKKALLKTYTDEIERLRRDLLATHKRDGVYIPQDNYNEIQTLIGCQSKEIEEKINHIKALEQTIQDKEKLCSELQMKHEIQTSELNEIKNELHAISHVLKSANQRLEITENERDEQKHLVEKHAATEKVLLSQAQTLLSVADKATADAGELHDKVARKTQVEQKNESLGQQFGADIAQRFHDVEKDFIVYMENIKEFCSSVKNQSALSDTEKMIDDITTDLTNPCRLSATNRLSHGISMSLKHYQEWIENRVERAADMTESERQWMTAIFMKLAPKICRLVENETANVLQCLNDHVSQKLQQVSAYVKETITTICDTRLRNCERLCKSAREINKSVESILKNQNNIMQQRRIFEQVMEELFNQFNILKKAEEEHCTNTISRFDSVNEACCTIESEEIKYYEENVDVEKKFENDVERDLQGIRSNVARGTEENMQLARVTTKEGRALVSELQRSINASCNTQNEQKNQVNFDMKDTRQKPDGDKSEILCLIDDMHKRAVDTTTAHTKFVEQQKLRISNSFENIGRVLEDKIAESTDWNQRSRERLHRTQQRTDKFFVEDMSRDIPTGSTPARKEFTYPRQFMMTSPHERIVQSFRDARKLMENSEDEL